MRPLELLVVYLLLGLGVAGAMVRAHRPGAILAVPLWPLFLPTLLAAGAPPVRVGGAGRIDDAIEALRHALDTWDAVPVDCAASLDAARRGLCALAERHAQLDAVVGAPENDPDPVRAELEHASPAARPLLEARLAGIAQLRALRDDAGEDLERGLLGLGELATRVQVARFTGVAAADVAQQLAALAAAVDSAREVRRLAR